MSGARPIEVTEVILRDAHQSLIATRMRTEDMLPICEQLDAVGFWSLEVWGGATFDACIRFLKEDPWARLRQLRAALPSGEIFVTKQPPLFSNKINPRGSFNSTTLIFISAYISIG